MTQPGTADAEAAAAPPLPNVLMVPHAHRLVGRRDALDALRGAWGAARTGPGGVVLIGGEAGAGKTRLTAELSGEMHSSGACVLYGGCDLDLSFPYQPWVQAIDQLLAALPSDDRAALGQQLAPVAHLLTQHALPAPARPASVDGSTEQYRTYRAFATALVATAERWPTLVVLDDLHWAGAQTLALLRHLARSGLPERVLVVGTFRDTGDEITEPLAGCLADLRRAPAVTRLQLEGLPVGDVERFVEGAIGQPLDDDLRRLALGLAERTAGNPFYLGELWHHLTSSGHVTPVGDRWTVSSPRPFDDIPDSIREVTDDRLGRLSPAAQQVVQLAALSGERVDLGVVVAAAELQPDEASDGVGVLVDAGLLSPIAVTDTYRFTHALIRNAIIDTIPTHRRGRYHLALARAIDRQREADDHRGVLAELVHHYSAAGGPSDRIVHFGRLAARQAFRAAAYDEAVTHFETVLPHVTPAHGRAAVLVDLAAAQLRLGAYDASRASNVEAFRIAVEMHDATHAAGASVGYEKALHFAGLPGEPAVEMLDTALAMMSDGDLVLRVTVMASLGRALAIAGRASEGSVVADEAVALARAAADPYLACEAMQAQLLVTDQDARTEVELASELLRIADSIDDGWAIGYAFFNLIHAYFRLGMLDRAAEASAQSIVVAPVGRISMYAFTESANRAVLALAAADFAAAEQAVERTREIGAAHDGTFDEGVYGFQMYALRRAQGRLGEVAPVLERVASDGDVSDVWLPGLAALYAETGMVDEAREIFERLAPDRFAAVPRDSVWPGSLMFLTEVCLALGDREPAHVLADELTRYEGENLMVGMTMCLGPADRPLGGLASLLGDDARADAHFAAAIRLAERSGSPLWKTEAQYEWAMALSNRDLARAVELATEAVETATVLGIDRIASRPIPAPRPDAAAELPDGLSEREVDVLRLVATGRSNREIGAALYISQHTVANHVQAILRKTESANRTEASVYAVRQGLADRT